MQMYCREHLGSDPELQGQNSAVRSQVRVCAALDLAPARCSGDCILRMGRLNSFAAKAVDKELRGEEGEAPRPRGQEDTVVSDADSNFLSLKTFLSYSEETFRDSIIRRRT